MRKRLSARAAGAALAVAVAAALLAVPASPAHAQAATVTVNFNTDQGAPVRRAAGMLYGLTENGTNPPDQLLTPVGMRHVRAGGSQLDNPGGWAASVASYERRFASTRAQYQRITGLGGNFVMILNDIWGWDATWNPPFPGDNGDWTSYDAYLNRLIADVQAAGMNPQWDIWNEPDITLFWNRPQSQYLAMWQRGYQRIRQSFPNAVIVGPSTAGSPTTGSAWWNTFLDFVDNNNVVPDIVSWHALASDPFNGDPSTIRQAIDGMLAQRGIPRPYQINEYGASSRQNPGASAWYIARLERNNIDGLRANWGSGPTGLHNNLAAMLNNAGGQYQTKGDWVLYREYAAMTGTRVAVTPGGTVDGFATRDAGAQQARVLLGTAGTTGTVTVNLTGLGATPFLVQDGQVRVTLQRVPFNNGGTVTDPTTVFDQNLPVSNNAASFQQAWGSASDAYVVLLRPPAAGGGGPVQPGVFYQLIAAHSGKAIDIEQASTQAGAAVIQWAPNGGQNQHFQFIPTGDGYYQIAARHSNLLLDLFESNPNNGATIVQWTTNGGTNQQWQVIDRGSGQVSLINRLSGRALDVWEASTADGARISQWDSHGGTNQRFQLVQVG
jgi:hypothetical protein